MRKVLSAAIFAAAMLASTAASAASLLFQFDPAKSSVTVTNQGTCIGFGCFVTPTLDLPTGTFAIEEGTTQSFNFAKFKLSGIGADVGVQIAAKLAFLSPNAGPAASNASAYYGTIFGVFSGGKLTWDPVAPITTPDGSVFTVKFHDLSGLKAGTIGDKVSITVNSVAVPEPASWALMIGGFSMAGAMLRRRRQTALAAA